MPAFALLPPTTTVKPPPRAPEAVEDDALWLADPWLPELDAREPEDDEDVKDLVGGLIENPWMFDSSFFSESNLALVEAAPPVPE